MEKYLSMGFSNEYKQTSLMQDITMLLATMPQDKMNKATEIIEDLQKALFDLQESA